MRVGRAQRFIASCLAISVAAATHARAADVERPNYHFPTPAESAGVELIPADWATVDRAPLTPAELDAMIARRQAADGVAAAPPATDERFIRRVALDLTGVPPTEDEIATFVEDASIDKRSRLIDRLLEAPEFNTRQAEFWADVMQSRATDMRLFVMMPRIVALPHWLAQQLALRRTWAEIATDLVTSYDDGLENKIDKTAGGQGGFLLCHTIDDVDVELANDTARVFLGLNFQCAQCHDSPEDVWKRDQFYELAAYYARYSPRILPRGNLSFRTYTFHRHTEPDREYPKPDQYDASLTSVVHPVFPLSGEAAPQGLSDTERRRLLAEKLTSKDNYYFAANFVNRVWAHMLGQSFSAEIENIGPLKEVVYPEVLMRLAAAFAAGDYDIRSVYRLIANSRFYQSEIVLGDTAWRHLKFAGLRPRLLDAGPLWQALQAAIGELDPDTVLPGVPEIYTNIPRPLSYYYRETFAYNPSLDSGALEETLPQILFLMNAQPLADEIDADGDTPLADILAHSADDAQAVQRVYLRVLKRCPTAAETRTCLEYLVEVGDREAAFEDLTWTLVNSIEFRMKR